MNRPLFFISLGGMNDVSVLCGHSYSYESSTYGQLAQCLMTCKTNSPLLVFDEVDKVADECSSSRAQEIIALLIHLTDPAANHEIKDRYFGPNIPLDFSKSCMLFTMNDPRRVSPILRDRLTIIEMQPPSKSEKVEIAERFLIPRETQRADGVRVRFDTGAVRVLVDRHSARERGVRALARAIRRVVEVVNVAQRGGAHVLRTVNLRGAVELREEDGVVLACPHSHDNKEGDAATTFTVSSAVVEQILAGTEDEPRPTSHHLMYC